MRKKEYLNFGDKSEPITVNCNHQEDKGKFEVKYLHKLKLQLLLI